MEECSELRQWIWESGTTTRLCQWLCQSTSKSPRPGQNLNRISWNMMEYLIYIFLYILYIYILVLVCQPPPDFSTCAIRTKQAPVARLRPWQLTAPRGSWCALWKFLYKSRVYIYIMHIYTIDTTYLIWVFHLLFIIWSIKTSNISCTVIYTLQSYVQWCQLPSIFWVL